MFWENINARLENLAANSIARALAISLIFHFFLFSSVEIAYRLGWTKQSLLSALLMTNPRRMDPRVLSQAKKNEPQTPNQVPVVFVEVDPTMASEQAPKQAQYYSSLNSRAANPDPRTDSNTPKIAGKQDKVAKTTDTPRTKPLPLQPAPAVQPKPDSEVPKAEPQPLQPKLAEVSPQSGPKPGDLAFAKPSDAPKFSLEPKDPQSATESVAAHIRPRKLPPALTQEARLAGEKMKQDGGVRRYSIAEGLDVQATPFGAYDAAIIAAIQKRWYDLLDERDFARGFVGKVVLTFRLNSNGTITQMRIEENEVSEILALICQRAVLDPAPYPEWPNDMRRRIGTDYREVKFTFHHN